MKQMFTATGKTHRRARRIAARFYEVMDGNTSDKTTLRGFLDKIEGLYGKARRVWLMDRGVPTEAILAEMRAWEE